jgi:hypothetical protein
MVALLFFMLRIHVWPLLAKRVVGRHVVKRSDGAQLAEIAALTDYRKAQTELSRAKGSLLEDRNIQIR